MKYSFAGHLVLVTGAGSGIGEATAHLLADNGFAVVVADLDATPSLRVANAITHAGGRSVAHMPNVANPDDAQPADECAEQPFGALHFACKHAGIGGGQTPPGR